MDVRTLHRTFAGALTAATCKPTSSKATTNSSIEDRPSGSGCTRSTISSIAVDFPYRRETNATHVAPQGRCPFREPHLLSGGMIRQAWVFSIRETSDGEPRAGCGEGTVLAGRIEAAGGKRGAR